MQPELLELADDEVIRLAEAELKPLLSIQGEAMFSQVCRWENAMPQYHVGHLDIVRRIDELTQVLKNFALAGNAYRGVGIPACIRNGRAAAERILDCVLE